VRRLIIRPGAIGDFVVSLPAMEYLRTDYVEVWTTSVNTPLARFADRSDSIVSAGLDALVLGEPVLQRLDGFDSIVSWYGTNRPEFREAVKHLPFTFYHALPLEGAALHAVDYYLLQVGAPVSAVPSIRVNRSDGEFIAIHPFSGGRRKNWPLARFRELAARLGEIVGWSAGPEEPLDAATRFDDLWSLAQWLARASLFVGNDSGISHLAAACGVPVVALFGPTDPRVWAPRGTNVRVVASRDGAMESITVDEVVATCEDMRRRP
jgi:heptosyltransferase-3